MTTRVERELATAALGLLDSLTPAQVEAAIEGHNKGARIRISPVALRSLLMSVEAAFPDSLAQYKIQHAHFSKSRGK